MIDITTQEREDTFRQISERASGASHHETLNFNKEIDMQTLDERVFQTEGRVSSKALWQDYGWHVLLEQQEASVAGEGVK